MLELQDFLKIVISDGPCAADWTTMVAAVDRLRPITNATEDVEQDKASLLTIMKYVCTIFLSLCVCFTIRHVDNIKSHWSDQTSFTMFHTPALLALDRRCGKHFSGTIHLLARALCPSTDLSRWSSTERNKVNGSLSSYCLPLLKKQGHGEECFHQGWGKFPHMKPLYFYPIFFPFRRMQDAKVLGGFVRKKCFPLFCHWLNSLLAFWAMSGTNLHGK